MDPLRTCNQWHAALTVTVSPLPFPLFGTTDSLATTLGSPAACRRCGASETVSITQKTLEPQPPSTVCIVRMPERENLRSVFSCFLKLLAHSSPKHSRTLRSDTDSQRPHFFVVAAALPSGAEQRTGAQA